MSIPSLKRIVASTLVASLVGSLAPAVAAPATSTLTGTVLGSDVATPLAGVTVVVQDASGQTLSSAPTGPEGTFTIAGVGSGSTRIALTAGGDTYPVATPVVLAPGQTRGVRVALKGKAEDDDDKPGAVPPGDGGKGLGGMIAVLVGFVAASAVAIGQSDDDDTIPAASPSNPE